MTEPTLRVLSLGAGRQSTALAILAARGVITDRLDAAIFADTGWEPAAVYRHLDRLEAEVLAPAGIPLYRVGKGNIRNDALDPDQRFASMPLYVLAPPYEVPMRVACPDCDGSDEQCRRCGGAGEVLTGHTRPATRREREGIARRQCTSEYKLAPILRKIRELLGATQRADGVWGRVPAGRVAEQWIGFSVDERVRALDTRTTSYTTARWPLLELGLSTDDCVALCQAAGFGDVAKSACIGCPYHGNAAWRRLRDQHPDEWQDAVAFDHAIRGGSARANALGRGLRGEFYLHRSRVPLDVAPIDRVTSAEWQGAQGDLVSLLSAEQVAAALVDDDAEVIGCGPHACRIPGDPVDADELDEVDR